MDRLKGIFSSILNAISPKTNKSLDPVFAVSGDERIDTLYDHSSSSEDKKSVDELIASWKAQPEVHSHIFSSEELVKATDNFNSKNIVNQDGCYAFYKGFFGNQPILIKKFNADGGSFPSDDGDDNIRDMVVASQLSDHGSSLKLIGFCEKLSAQVFEYKENVKFLSNGFESLQWRNRVSVAHDIAKALVILHTSFSTPLILRDLKPSKILMDESGVAKLLDFSLCIQIPGGESQVEDAVMGTYGYAEPQYVATGVLTEKSDVFSFGVVLLELLTGLKAFDCEKKSLLHEWAEVSLKKGKLKKVVDRRMIDDGEFAKREKEFRAFGALALKCTQESRKERPQMVDVAAELARIRSFT